MTIDPNRLENEAQQGSPDPRGGVSPVLFADEELTVEELELVAGGVTGTRIQCGAPGHQCPVGFTHCYAGMCYL
jgi:hypothetical protein